jgi:hypothetical protein
MGSMGLLLFTRDVDVCHLPWWPQWPWWPLDLHGRNAPRVGHLANDSKTLEVDLHLTRNSSRMCVDFLFNGF